MASPGYSRSARSGRAQIDPQGYYRLLGVGPSASSEDIKLAFRDRAKKLHPDHGGSGADAEAFRRLLEAYEVLRDDRKREAYDNVARTESVNGGGRRRSAARPRRRKFWIHGRFLQSRSFWTICVLAFLLLGMTVLWRESERSLRDHQNVMAQLYQQLDRAKRANEARTQQRYRSLTAGAGSGPGVSTPSEALYAAEIAFSFGATSLIGTARGSAERAVSGLAEAIDGLPEDGQWLVLVEGRSDRAAERSGVAIEDWEQSLLRMASLIGFVVAQGIPAERLAVRFEAGLGGDSEATPASRTVRIELLCCAD